MIDFTNEKEAKEYLAGLKIEYSYQCYKEKSPEGCQRLGDFFEMQKEFTKASQVFKANCNENKFGKSCFKYGNFATLGIGKLKKEEGLEYHEKACDHKFARACYFMGIRHMESGHRRNVKKALKYFEQGCALDNQHSCFRASGLYIMDRDIPKDLKKAHDYSLKACNRGNIHACSNLSEMYRKGDGVAVNSNLSEKYKNMAQKLLESKKS